MNKIPVIFVALTLMLVLVSCDGRVDTQLSPTQVPVEIKSPVAITVTESPALQPINLAGPPAGTPMIWVDGSILVHVPGGEFIMGNGGDDNLLHTVGLSSYWIYRTKVTNRMYSICVAVGECSPPLGADAVAALSDPFKRDDPVVNVNWIQAQLYCEFVEGQLPTEAQWEKTARGPDGNIYPWGDAAPTCNLLNFKDCIGEISEVFDYPVGKSYYDALDLSGNVFEWVLDWYTPQYYSEAPTNDPQGPEISEVRSVRSSGFNSEASMVSSARRFFLKPEEHRLDLGFRCVVIDPPEYAPFCEQVFIPGYPERKPESSSSINCPVPEFKTFVGECVDQKAQLGNGSVRISGGEIVSAISSDCSEAEPGLWFCTGLQGTSASLTACLACEESQQPGSIDITCPPGTYDNGEGECVGRGDFELCPNGYFYSTSNQCCTPEANIPYPGCDPASEFLTAVNTCQPGSPPLGDACALVSVPLGSCRDPNSGGDDGGNQCSGLDLRTCATREGECIWDKENNQCIPY